MRKIFCIILVSLALSFTAQSQTSEPKAEPPKKEAAKDAPKGDNKAESEETIDLDAFFKKGEENAKKGTSCRIPA